MYRITAVFILCTVFIYANAFASERAYSENDRRRIFSYMKSNSISVITTGNAIIYAEKDETSEIVASVPEGHFLQIHEDFSMEWYYASEILTGQTGWVKRSCIEIPLDTAAGTEPADKFCIEGFINLLGFESKTGFFVLTDIKRQKTYIFHGKKGDWSLIKILPCSTGRNESPTIKGLYTLIERGDWFYSERLGSGAKYWVRFKGAYLFHSQAMDRHKNILPEKNEIGSRVSNGCIRFYLNDAEWFYRNVPDNTSVFIQ